jgi:hypothetical protein
MRPTPAVGPRDLLTCDDLRALFAPLTDDYCRAVALTADLAITDRRNAITARLEAYGEALGEALGEAVDQATATVIGPWAIGGQR